MTLEHHDYWTDEIHTLRAIRLNWSDLVVQRAGAGHPPLFFFVEKAISILFGTTEGVLRIFPFVCGIGSVVTVYWVLLRTFRESAAIMGCLLFALSPAQLFISQMARSYVLLQLVFWLFIFLVISRRVHGRKELVGGMLLCACAVYTHSLALLWIPVLLISILLAWPERWGIVLAGAIGTATYLPLKFLFNRVNDPSHAVSETVIKSFEWLELPARLYFGRHLRDVPVLVVILATILMTIPLLGLRIFGRTRDDSLRRFFFMSFLAICLISTFFAIQGTNFVAVERYFAPLFPLTAFVVAWWVEIIEKLGVRSRGLCNVALLLAGFASSIVYIRNPPFLESRAVAQCLTKNRTFGESVLFYGLYSRQLPFEYYYPNNYVMYFVENKKLQLQKEQLAGKGFWVLVSPADSLRLGMLMGECERVGARLENSYDFRGERLIYFRLYSSGAESSPR